MGLLIGNVSNNILPDAVKAALNEDVPMYGVKFPSDSTVGVRTYDAAQLKWERSSNTIEGVDDFKSIAPFITRECCRVWDSTNKTATFVYKDDYNDTEWNTIRKGTHATISGDIMVEFSEFWYRRINTQDGLEIIVAPKYKVGFNPDPWHYRNGEHIEKTYISKYDLVTGFKSISGVATLTSTTMDTFRTNLVAKGMELISVEAYYSIVMLMLVKYACTSVRATVSAGRNSGDATISSGNADSVLGDDGSATSVSTNEASLAMKVENFWGNCWTFLDHIWAYNGTYYYSNTLTKNPSTGAELSVMTNTGITYATSASNESITTIANDSVYDWFFAPSNASTKTTLVTDDAWWVSSKLNLVGAGGTSWGGSPPGLFAFAVYHVVSHAAVNYGSRAVC